MKIETAVEWLATELYEKIEMRGDGKVLNDIIEKAIEMDKAQKIDAYHTAQLEMIDLLQSEGLDMSEVDREDKTDAEEWYHKTYGTEQGNTEN